MGFAGSNLIGIRGVRWCGRYGSLIATACGIAVAVTSAVLYNYFTTRVKSIVQQFDLLSQEVAILVYTGHGKGGH